MTNEANSSLCEPWMSCTIVRGVDAAWMEDRAAEAEAARASWRAWTWSEVGVRGRDLRGAFLAGIDLRDADLTGCLLDRSVLIGANLAHASLDGVSARGADLRGASLVGASIVGADFGDAEFGDHPGCRRDDTRLPDDERRRGLRLRAVERGFDIRDAEGCSIRVVVAHDWQTALFRLARDRGATRLPYFDSSRWSEANRGFNTTERRCASGRAEDEACSRGRTVCQDE
jgi:uncharacterized protein YjbI with pentapeptide repeats